MRFLTLTNTAPRVVVQHESLRGCASEESSVNSIGVGPEAPTVSITTLTSQPVPALLPTPPATPLVVQPGDTRLT